MGNKQGHELSPEEKQRLKEEKRLLKEDKEHKKRLRKIEQRRLKDEKRKGTTGSSSAAATPATVKKDTEDAQSVGGSSVWSEKSVGSAPESWYHSASEPGSKRSSIYLPASAGPGYYQHDCWYSGYEDSGSEKSKPTSRAGSRPGSRPPSRAPSVKDTLNLRSSSLERYPLGVPTGEAIEPMHKAGSLDLANVVATNFLENREQLAGELEIAAAIASRYDETIRASKEQLEKTSVDKASLIDRASLTDKVSLTSSVYHSAEEGSTRGEKRKVHLEDRESLSSVYYSADEASIGSKRKVLDYGSDHTSATGSIYYSADEGGSVAGSVYYTATSGSEVEDHVTDAEILGKDRPSPPSKPVAVDREGSALSRLAYIKVENDALLLHWEAPESDGGTPISGYILERCEGDGDFWVRVNLVPIKDTEYAVANLIGGREYRFRVSAENAVGVSDPSERSEMVSISTDQEATEPHFLKELRDVTAVEGHRVEFIVDIIGTPPPDVSWYKDGFEIFDTKRFEFIADGDRYSLVLKEAKISDAGDIRVRATNRVGVASSQAVLHIQAPPRITLPPQYEQGLIFDTDELIRLRVPYTGRPPPLATWAHNGKEIEADDRHTMDVSEKYITLKIAGANRADKGMYSLNLANPQGIDNVSFFVTVTDRPDPPSMPVVTDITGQSVTLRWDPPQDDGGCRISNYIVEYFRMGWDVWLKGASSRITWTQLSELIVGSEYRFRVKAENAYGVSDPGEECEPVLIDETKSPSGYGNPAGCLRDSLDQVVQSARSLHETVNLSAEGLSGNLRSASRVSQGTNNQQIVHFGTRGTNNTIYDMNQGNQGMAGDQGFIAFAQNTNAQVNRDSGMTPGISSIKRSCEDRQLTVEEQRQKILKTIANQSLIAFRSDDSDTEVGSSPDSTSEYSSESTVKYVGTAGSSKTALAMASAIPKVLGNPNPSYHLGFVSNGCSKVNYLGSVIGVETDDESSASSSKSPSLEHSVSPVIPSTEDSSRRLFPPPPAPVNYQSGPIYYATFHSTPQAAAINPTFQFPMATVGQSIFSTRDSLQSASMKIFSNTSLSSRLRSVDQSDMNLYYEQMKDKIEMPPDFYSCSVKQAVSATDGDSQSSEDTSLQDDSDTDTIVYSPSKGTDDADHAVHESRDTAQPAEGETGEGVTSIPLDTTASKSWSTHPSGTIGSPSVVTDGTQHALRETCSTLQGTGAGTGEGISSIPLDTQDSSKSKSQSLATSAPSSNSASSSTTTSGEPWTARVAIAQKFRIICGGLASMTHLGNINALAANAGEDSDETESEELSRPRDGSKCRLRTFSNDETIDEEIGSIQSEEATGNEAEIFKDDDEVCGSVLPYQQMVQVISPPYNPSASFISDYPQFSNQTFMSENALYLSPQSPLKNYCQITSPQSFEEITVFYQPTLASGTAPIKQDDEQVTQVPKTYTRSDVMGITTSKVSHSSMSSKLGQMSHEPDKSDDHSKLESSGSTGETSGDDKHASWEPKINKAITARINLLEDLVYRCLENEDAALYEMESTEEEGAAAPLTSLSRTGSSSRVDVSRSELRDLISDLEGIVSSMNERSRTLSADNVAKFFEKTASVVGDHGSSSSSSVHSKGEAADIKKPTSSGKSLRSHSMIEIEKALSEGEDSSSSGRESVADVFQPEDQIHIKPSILKRIDHLEEIMSRCLENEDVTMNTLGSGILSPSSSQKEVPQEQHHTSKVELKDLIGDLGSLVSNLGQRFNPDKK